MRCDEVLAFDELHHEGGDAVGLLEAVNARDVGMIQRGEQLRFALEPREPVGVLGERVAAAP